MTEYGKPHLFQDRWGYLIGGRWVDEREISHEERPWRPFRKTIPYRADGTPDSDVLVGREDFYANSHYLVFKRFVPGEDPENYLVHLSLRTVENDTRHDWREMQRVKTELTGPEWEAIEIYPAESRVVDTANQYHLWCFPFAIGIGFAAPLRIDAGEPHPYGDLQVSQRPFRKD